MKRPFTFIVLVTFATGFKLWTSSQKWKFVRPPAPKYGQIPGKLHNSDKKFQIWDIKNETNIWEHSGLFEGDIMLYDSNWRNGIINESLRWPNATVPFYIEDEDFTDEEVMVILHAIQEYHNRTCIRFKPYEETDENYVLIKGNSSGCWSAVGMRNNGQIVNLSTPKCVKHGVILHELLHALGFFHQQSAPDRDDYVIIHWENILAKHEFNFRKYNNSIATSFDIPYDYTSIMHYSAKAFSKNGKPTIEPLEKDVKIGQRKGLSEKDVIKLNKMYEKSCSAKTTDTDYVKELIEELIKEFEKGFKKENQSIIYNQ